MTRYPAPGSRRRMPASAFAAGFGAVAALVLSLAAGCAPTTDEDALVAGIGTPRAARAAGAGWGVSRGRGTGADVVLLTVRVWLPLGLSPEDIRAVILALN